MALTPDPCLHGRATWSPLAVVHSEYAKHPGTWIGNPAPVIDKDTGKLWLICSRNNTDVLALSSSDWGRTWGPAKVISSQVLAPAWHDTKPSWQGGWGWVATTGGVQLSNKRLLIAGDVQTPPTANCSVPYTSASGTRRSRQAAGLLGDSSKVGDGKACSQSWVMFSDTHGESCEATNCHFKMRPSDRCYQQGTTPTRCFCRGTSRSRRSLPTARS